MIKLTICPRCGNNNVYISITLSKEKKINCSQCGFTGPVKQLIK